MIRMKIPRITRRRRNNPFSLLSRVITAIHLLPIQGGDNYLQSLTWLMMMEASDASTSRARTAGDDKVDKDDCLSLSRTAMIWTFSIYIYSFQCSSTFHFISSCSSSPSVFRLNLFSSLLLLSLLSSTPLRIALLDNWLIIILILYLLETINFYFITSYRTPTAHSMRQFGILSSGL